MSDRVSESGRRYLRYRREHLRRMRRALRRTEMRRNVSDRLHRPVGGLASIKSGGSLFHHVELTFERDSYLPNQSVIKQAAQDGDAVRHAPRRVELRQRIRRIRRPIAARFGNFDKTCAQGQRWMSGEVRDRELFIAQ